MRGGRLGGATVLLAAALLASTACTADGSNDSSPPTTRATCTGADPGQQFDTFMTLQPPSPTVEFEVSVTPRSACPGDTVRFTVEAENHTAEAVRVESDLVITEPLPHVVLARLDPFTLEAGDERTITTEVVLPSLDAGTYEVFVRGWESSRTALEVRAA